MRTFTRVLPAAIRGLLGMLFLVLACSGVVKKTSAQSLNWDGQDGIFVTPLAYTVPGKQNGFDLPAVSYHFVDAGPVLGNFNQLSITEGAYDRFEFGYTRDIHTQGSTAGLSNLWGNGFNIFHGKVGILKEGRRIHPAISVGFVARTQMRNIDGMIQGKNTSSGDFYVVATKTVDLRHLPLVFNAGFKMTNASILGLAGNAPGYQGRFFGAAAFAVKGPGRSTILIGSEILQEPRRVEDLPGVIIPTTVTYAVRIIPAGALPIHGWSAETPRLTIDFGLLQAAGNVAPGLNLDARNRFAFGISYGF